MVDSKPRSATLKKLARWTPSSSGLPSDGQRKPSIPPLSNDAPFINVHHDNLQQGALYIIKIKQVSLALFEGWNDDMCCFSILRSELEPLRWSEARQLPGDFDIYEAFDECGNPPIHLWSRYLRVSVPNNWFSMFEEGKRKQNEWSMQQEDMHHNSLIQQQHNQEYYHPEEPVVNDNSPVHNQDMPAYSNTDVSSMHLNNNNTATSPSIVASTNIVDPNMNAEDSHFQEPSINDSTVSVNHQPDYSSTRRQMIMSPSPSYHSHIVQPPERTNSIMDREQIRRHLAPGQAVLTNRNSSSVVTLDSVSVANRSKEYATNESLSSAAVSNVVNQDLTSKLIISSSISTHVDFPHDSDRFSNRSDIHNTESPTILPSSTSSKSRNRFSMKKAIWG